MLAHKRLIIAHTRTHDSTVLLRLPFGMSGTCATLSSRTSARRSCGRCRSSLNGSHEAEHLSIYGPALMALSLNGDEASCDLPGLSHQAEQHPFECGKNFTVVVAFRNEHAEIAVAFHGNGRYDAYTG